MMNWYVTVLKKYAEFNGRSRRSEYWYFVLISTVISWALMGLGIFLLDLPFISYIYTLAAFIPGVAVWVRRLHDVGRSGWWMLIGLIPLIGFIILIVWAATDSQPGSNPWGPNPKETGDDIAEHLIEDDSLV